MNTTSRIRTALLTVVENYSAMGIDTVPRFVDRDRKAALRILRKKGAEIVADTLVHDARTMMKAILSIIRKKLDILVINVIGWAGGESALVLARKTLNIPMIVWTTPTIRMALCGYFEFTSDLKSVGRPFKSIIGKEARNVEEIESYLKAVKLAKKLRDMKFGQVGNMPPGFVDARGDKCRLEKRLGIKVIDVNLAEVLSEIQRVKSSEVKCAKSELFRHGINQMVAERALQESLKASIALERVVDRHDLRGGGLRCLPELQTHSFPCLGVSTLSRKGVALACEGDVPAAITSVILSELTRNTPAVFDYDSIDSSRNILRLWHCGHLATNLVDKGKKMDLISPTYFDQAIGPGAVLSFSVKPGKATLAKLNRNAEKMLVLSGEVITPRKKPTSAYAEVKLNCDVSKAVKAIAAEGLEHHVCLVHGDATSEIIDFCQLLGIQSIECKD